jgi:putative hydrolase of the HAD superfamily
MNQKDTGYLNRIFDRMFLSYRMGMVKPDLEIYHAMIKALDLPPSRILFLDDNQINVDAAIEAGITAHRVRGVSESRTLLESLKPGDVKN